MITLLIHSAKGVLRALYHCLKLLPQKKKIVFLSRQRNKASVDFRLLAAAARSREDAYQPVILCKKMPLTVSGVVGYMPHFFKQLYHLATCSAVVVDGYVPAVSLLKHRPNVRVLQTWHALGAIKKFGFQSIGTEFGHSARIAASMNMHQNYDYVLCAGDGTAPAFIEAFNVTADKLLFIAPPYTERQLDAEAAQAARQRVVTAYPQVATWEKSKTVLYIPTFHGKIEGLSEMIATLINSGFHVIFSRHPLDAVNSFEPDASLFAQVRENYIENTRCISLDLQHVAGHIITDYSATVLDAALLKTPFAFYVPDIDSYRCSPGLNIDPLNEFPSIATTRPGDVARILQDEDAGRDALEHLRARYLNHVQHDAATRIIDVLLHSEARK